MARAVTADTPRRRSIRRRPDEGRGQRRPESVDPKSAFHALVEDCLDPLYRTASRLTRNPDDAEDLVQDAVLKGWRSFEQFQGGSSFKTWITRILINLYLDRWKAAQRRGEGIDLQGEEFSLYEALQYRCGRSPSPDVAEQVLSNLGVERIRSAVDRLPPGERMVVTLADIEGFSYEEVASTLCLPLGTVKSRLFRGRRELQKRLWEYAQKVPR